MPKRRALSAKEVDAISKNGLTWVDDNLYLQVRPDGTRSWIFRYERVGKVRSMGLGPCSRVSLTDARRMAGEHRVALWNGADPVAEKKARRVTVKETRASSTAPTFGWCADQYIAAHEASWKSPIHRRQWVQTLEDYCGPVIGKMSVDQVDVDDVLKVLQPIWTSKPETAGRLRGRISKVLGWAKAKGYRSGDDPAARGGPLDHLLPSLSKVQTVRHHASVPYQELRDLVVGLRGLDSISAKALLFTILTAARTGETLGATWEEVDLEGRLWSIPAETMKAAREHKVPLSDEVIALLESLPTRKGLLFPGARKGKPLSNMAMVQCLRGLRDDGSTVHGMRATFSTWAREQTGFSEEVIEHALAHGHKSKVIGAYARTTRLEQRRELMQEWADYLNGEE